MLPLHGPPTNLVLLLHVVPPGPWLRETLTLVGRALRFVNAAEVAACVDGTAPLKRTCHVTFDDGDRAVYDLAFPVLKELGVPATVFVSPKVTLEETSFWFQDLDTLLAVGAQDALRAAIAERHPADSALQRRCTLTALLKSMPFRELRGALDDAAERAGISFGGRHNLSRAEVLELHHSGLVTFGAHTLDHPVLTNESNEDARAQIIDSVTQLSELLDAPVEHFAYPNGDAGLDFGPREQAALRECGVRVAYAADSALYGPDTDPLAVPRAGLSGSARENAAWITARLLLTPVWGRVRTGGHAWRERRQRESLAAAR
ncbi:MAG: polysaccharide deacetylase family protein [Pseudomonadota bacterium]